MQKSGKSLRGLLIFPLLKDLNAADGVMKKNEGIHRGFLDNGIDVEVLDFTSRGITGRDGELFRFSPRRAIRIWQFYIRIWQVLSRYVAKQRYDFIWLRMPLITGAVASFVQQVKRQHPGCRLILEYGAYPFIEELSGKQRLHYRLNARNERKAHSSGDYIITYCGQEKVGQLPNIPINNGIDIDSIPVNTNTYSSGDPLVFICVSSMKKWHAYERFIEGLPAYLAAHPETPVRFELIGDGPEHQKLRELVAAHQLDDIVTFHGFKKGRELDELYNRSHVAIGTLGFHRIGITNSSSLKNREYFARGLPIVVSTKDEDMPESLPYVLYVPDGEQPLDIAAIVRFSQEAYQRPGIHEEIRRYAEQQISWTSKIRTVLSYLQA